MRGDSAVEFRLLGGIEAHRRGQLVDVGHARQQCVLAVLLVQANTTVSVDELIDRVWADRPPHRSRETLHSYLTRLRRILADTGADIGRRGNSYQLSVDESHIDLHRFRQLTSAARMEPDDKAVVLLENALRLWRGEPFAGLDTPWLHGVRQTLSKERLAAELDHTDLELRLGNHTKLLAPLSVRAEKFPLDERLAGQLMVALYRSGRQADALNHYHHARRQLDDELGVEPSPELRELHHQILANDPRLIPVQERRTPAPVGNVVPVPRQLPPPPRSFTGREAELGGLTARLDAARATVRISVIAGTGGVGKTWLALHWAHQNLHRFPDGQLFVNLRGFDPSGKPISLQDAVRGFLEALGVDPAAIPVALDAQVGLYRSLVADKRMLIVIDNAANTSQVAPLLPGSPTCTVLVTSRDRLSSLIAAHDAYPVQLDVLPEADARALLRTRLGAQRLAGEPQAVDDLLTSCAGLPMALSIVAGRAQEHPEFPLASLAAELHDTTNRLAALDAEPLKEGNTNSVRAILSWSYTTLTPQHATTFDLLGLAPGPDISRTAATNLTHQPPTTTHTALRALERASLIHQHTPNRYRMHDLIRLYAQEQAANLPVEVRTCALLRLVDFYLHTAYAADRLLDPMRVDIDIDAPTPGCEPLRLTSIAAAMAWFDAEHDCLSAAQQLAAQQDWPGKVLQLAWCMNTYRRLRGHVLDNVAAWRTAIAASRRIGDGADYQSLTHRMLGQAYNRAGRPTEAGQHLARALALAERADDRLNQALAHHALGLAMERQADDEQALDHVTVALRLFSSLDRPVLEARALNTVGWFAARTGRYALAEDACRRGLSLLRVNGDRVAEADALDSLGYLAHRTGRYSQAIEYFQQAIAGYRDLANTYSEGGALEHLGNVYAELRSREQAAAAWQAAMVLYQAHHRGTDSDRVQQKLASLDRTDDTESPASFGDRQPTPASA
ncbi:MAG TPA: BTAD domain-containing putative transcriptional regulator [Pseudonocardiaceae bacterium]|nr:BTAD domain-containing putative transcriptional regulator [Pseudonocardiaceae bacterium]